MATKHLKSKTRPTRNRTNRISAETPATRPSADKSSSPSAPLLFDAVESAIEAERAQLLQAHGLLKCLTEVLLYADDEQAMHHADIASVAAKLIDESVERLDPVQLRSSVEEENTGGEHEYPDLDDFHTRKIDGVKDSAYAGYLC